jgi:thiol reductant ABC exporter CydC subunit
LGFFPPTEGEIRVNDQVLRDPYLASWREHIAWVPQEPALFQDTIAANIRLARPEANPGAVAGAASAAHLAGFIESTPEGYDTPIGEGGSRLSGGQAQRLALARAFLKDAPILILDEPTSQLDPLVESQLADSTQKLMEGRTTITIAHRLNTIYQADRILVLKNGSLVEEGSHHDLIQRGGVYRDLVQAYTGGVQEQELISTISTEKGAAEPGIYTEPSDPRIFEETPGIQNRRSILGRLLAFFRPHWGEVALSILLGFLTIGSSVSLMGASAWLISSAALHPPLGTLQVAIVGVRFFGILRGVSRYAERLVSHNLTFKILTRIRVWFYQSLVPLAPARLMKYRSGDLLSRIISDIKILEDFFVRSLSPPLVAVLVGLGTSLFLGYYRIDFALVLILFFTLSGLFLPLTIRSLAREPGIQLVKIRALLVDKLVSFTQGLPDLMVFGRIEDQESGLEILGRDYNQSQLKLARISGMGGSLVAISRDLAMWLILILAIPLVSAGQLPGALLATLSLMVLASFEAIQPLTQAMETLSSSITAGSRLLEVLDDQPAVADPEISAPFPAQVVLEAKDLSFSYPDSSGSVLKGLDFSLDAGSTLALVGPSGSGKTTLANLLLKFWGGYQGELAVGPGGTDLSSIPGEMIRKNISVISQRGYLFNDTIRANLKLGRPNASDDEMVLAAKKARIHNLIQSTPEGYETMVGERGFRFSSGERQRMEVARAILKDAPLFILDEPTANLDPITERSLLDTLFEILENKTAILITHRLVGLDRVEQILVLVGGRIIERGSEGELLAKGGFYQEMWRLQNRILSY